MEVEKIVDVVAPIVEGCKNGDDVGKAIMVFGRAIGVLVAGCHDRVSVETGLQIIFTAIRTTAIAVHLQNSNHNWETFLRDHFNPEKQNG